MHLVACAVLCFDLLVLSKLAGCLLLICFVTIQTKHFSCCTRRTGEMSLYLQFQKIFKIKLFYPNLWREILTLERFETRQFEKAL